MNNTGPTWNFPQNTANLGQNNYTLPNTYQPVWNRPSYPTLPGKLISSMQDIKPNEIPFDGSPSIFPASDFSCIFVKAWGQDGNIQTVKYVPEQQQQPAQQQQVSTEYASIIARIDELENFIKSNLYKNNTPQQNRKPTKEGGNNQ